MRINSTCLMSVASQSHGPHDDALQAQKQKQIAYRQSRSDRRASSIDSVQFRFLQVAVRFLSQLLCPAIHLRVADELELCILCQPTQDDLPLHKQAATPFAMLPQICTRVGHNAFFLARYVVLLPAHKGCFI